MVFSTVRPYMPGDDVRTLDWNITARMGDPYVKEYVEERELTVMILMDMSGSFQVSTTTPSRREYAAEIGAVFAMSATLNQDHVGLIGFSQSIEYVAPPKRDRNHLLRLLQVLFTFSARDRGTDLSAALTHTYAALKQRSLVIIISDFLTSHSDWEKSLRQVSSRHDVIAVCIRDPREAQLPAIGLVAVRDAETNQMYLINTKSASLQEQFASQSRERLEHLKSRFQEAKIDGVFLSPGDDYLAVFIQLFERRTRRA
jgi:uncharacterized protein (DUF58 family)